MQTKSCEACGETFRPRAQRPDQRFCSASSCQRERRRLWQQARRQSDPDYRDNEARGERAWRQRHADYWKSYRQAHPAYAEGNRMKQRARDLRRARRLLANGDVCRGDSAFVSGTYLLSPAPCGDLANGDVWTVEIRVLSTVSALTAASCK